MVLLPVTDQGMLVPAGQYCRTVQWDLRWWPFCGGSDLFSAQLSLSQFPHLLWAASRSSAHCATIPLPQFRHVESHWAGLSHMSCGTNSSRNCVVLSQCNVWLVPNVFQALCMPCCFQCKFLKPGFSAVGLLKQNTCSWSSQNSTFKRHTVKVLKQNGFEAVMCLIPDLNLITFDFQLLWLFHSLHCFKGLCAPCSWLLSNVQ